MQPRNLVLILARDLAEKLATAMFLVDHEGTLVFFNETAEQILGRTFADIGRMSVADWSTAFAPAALDGQDLQAEELPLVITLRERRPCHNQFKITGLDETEREIEVTALPLFARTDELVGAVAFFWELDRTPPGGGA